MAGMLSGKFQETVDTLEQNTGKPSRRLLMCLSKLETRLEGSNKMAFLDFVRSMLT